MWASRAFAPFRFLVGFFVSAVAMPLYRIYFPIRRHFLALWRPAKSRLMALVTNRYAVHVVMGVIALGVGVLNLQTTEVRAETFGERSLLYALVSQDQIEVIEEYAGDTSLALSPVSYRSNNALSAISRGVDDLGAEDPAAVSLIGGSIITAPSVSESYESTAARDEIESYIVSDGESLSSIADKFGISLNTLLWGNSLSVNSVIQPGDTLAILPTSGVLHTVSSGDTISRISAKYDISQEEIIAYNKLSDANDLVVGEQIIVPGGSVTAAAPASRSAAVASIFSSPPASSSTSSSAGSAYMIWPTDLRTITQYYGWRHTGVDIDCGWDNTNYAAMDGIVESSGWNGGYGYAIDINHGNGITTRYGHNASLYVSAGQYVSQGQAIGLCGTTGRSTGTHLHFEVIASGRFKNPLEYVR